MSTLVEKAFDKSNFVPRYDRDIEKGDLVGIHWNVRQNVWSIVAMKSRKSVGVVKGYAHEVTLSSPVTFHIEKSKQKQVIQKGAKDRHAFIVGHIESFEYDESLSKEVYYNPFKVASFVDKAQFKNDSNAPLLQQVERVTFTFNGKPSVYYR